MSEEEIKETNQNVSILMVGCGNSKLSKEMAIEDSFFQITNSDISQVVLDKMEKYTQKFE